MYRPLSCTVFELFDVEEYRDLRISVSGHSQTHSHWNDTILQTGCKFLFVFHGNYMALSCITSDVQRDDGRTSLFHSLPALYAPVNLTDYIPDIFLEFKNVVCTEKNQNGEPIIRLKKFENVFTIKLYESDGQTDSSHRTTAQAALMHSIARQKHWPLIGNNGVRASRRASARLFPVTYKIRSFRDVCRYIM